MEVVNRNQGAAFITKDGSEIRSILDRTNSTARNQSLTEATLPPGAATSRVGGRYSDPAGHPAHDRERRPRAVGVSVLLRPPILARGHRAGPEGR